MQSDCSRVVLPVSPCAGKARVLTWDSSALAKNFCIARCLSSLMVADDSLDVEGAGGAAGEAARYGIRGDGVVADEDGVAIVRGALLDEGGIPAVAVGRVRGCVGCVGSRGGRVGGRMWVSRRRDAEGAFIRRVSPRVQRADYAILSASRVRNFPSVCRRWPRLQTQYSSFSHL